ncbi:hypothetical protein LAE98_01850 [Bacillus wiedmannii]|uniref:hypothetical protein n=1 Tax=Bacillus wiedmannii TaxID=1890302 RepID=UPI001CC1B9A0|nr:hypothetical protein [Bacillus wiedmannii]MBZ4220878.1 hypothetical protein [Bacillus wiedmannii]
MNFKKFVSQSLVAAIGVTSLLGFSGTATQASIVNTENSKQVINQLLSDKEIVKLVQQNISSDELKKAQEINSKALSITKEGVYQFDADIAVSFGYTEQQAQSVKQLFESFSPEQVKQIESVQSEDIKGFVPAIPIAIALSDLLAGLAWAGVAWLAKQFADAFWKLGLQEACAKFKYKHSLIEKFCTANGQ